MAEKLKYVLGKAENIAGKGENAGYQHFLHFLTIFSKGFYFWILNVGTVWYVHVVNPLPHNPDF